ncbi:MAG: TIGR02444 family protein [Proteobacteria bacterium]|nr:TIGR02444 family protein [Pseudomonadota bacterium]
MKFPDNPCWDFALVVYRRDGVADACLALQDGHGIDVNVLLFCCWLGESGRGGLSAKEMADALALVDRWHQDVVRRLRAVRAGLKGGFGDIDVEYSDPLRGQIMASELDAEHVEHMTLMRAFESPAAEPMPPAEQRAKDAAGNVALYFDALGVELTEAETAQLMTILGGGFPDLDRRRLAAAIDAAGLAPGAA